MKLIEVRDWSKRPVGVADFVLVGCIVAAGIHWLGDDAFTDPVTVVVAISAGLVVIGVLYMAQYVQSKRSSR